MLAFYVCPIIGFSQRKMVISNHNIVMCYCEDMLQACLTSEIIQKMSLGILKPLLMQLSFLTSTGSLCPDLLKRATVIAVINFDEVRHLNPAACLRIIA
jgi:hypothetical protein